MVLTILLIFSIALVRSAFSSNILIACSIPSPSHQIWNYAFAEGLMEKGHNITMAGPDAHMHKPSDRYHPIVFEDIVVKLMASKKFDFEGSTDQSAFQSLIALYNYEYLSCKFLYESDGFKQILNYPKDYKFDLIIVDMTVGPCLHPLIQRFNYPPTIGTTAFLLPPDLSFSFGNYLPQSYLPHYHLSYFQNMTFSERVMNFVVANFELAVKYVYEANQIQKLAYKAFGEGMESVRDLEKHISLLLCNLSPAFHYPQPITPNIIPVGGLHARPAGKLPQDIQEIMDKSTNGVIIMALGTNVRSDKLRKLKVEAILGALSKLKQTVLWKFESDFDNLPKNVIIRKFLPQNDILAHPNTKLFISHGGGLSTLETAYHGVPILGIPFFIDQFMLTNAMVEKGVGLKLELSDVTTESLLNAINELLQNKKYSRNIKEISYRMKDQLSTPLQTAVFWAEYAIRHNGSHHLSPKSRHLPLFVSTSADVILFLLLIFALSLGVLVFSVRFLYKFLYSKPGKEKLN
ncbi:UDP-glucuronosyltransferase 2B2-like [Anoplophora glabripennis]|uniref:UDP-glucuronosyltransferase 2B2-like n=1 Tax=Anoplophora glabripennis TaxID=217634 RepID=UPI000873FC8E|nr:UDP-glucuronosyltransferase 2B2-like [Anoplophora glabripennis]